MTDRKGDPAIWALAFVVVLCFSLLVVGVVRNDSAISDANRALCDLRANDVASLQSTKRILAANPTGPVELAGVKFSHAEIVSDEEKLEQHIASYKSLGCSS